MMAWLDFVFCALFGWTGIHKFKERKVAVGTLYFLTVGLCGVGWITDTVRYLIIAVKRTMELGRAQAKRLAADEELAVIGEPELLERRYGEICYYEQNAARISSKAVSDTVPEDTLIVFGLNMPETIGRRRAKNINWSRADEMLGRLYVTSERLVITDGQEVKECPIEKILAVNLYRNLLLVKMNDRRLYIATDEAAYVYQIIARIYMKMQNE